MKTKLLVCLSALALPIFSLADWVKIDRFGTDFSNMYWALNPQVVGVLPLPQYVPDPENPNKQVFWYNPGGHGVSWNEQWMAIPLPQEAVIPVGAKGTLYFRYYMTTKSFDANIGLTNLPIVLGGEPLNFTLPQEMAVNRISSPMGYPSFEVQLNFAGSGSSKHTAVREPNPAGFQPLNYETEINEWIEHWIHIDNGEESYRVYYKRPGMEEPELASSIKEGFEGRTEFDFRNMRGQDLVTFYMSAIAGAAANPHSADPTYISDINIYVGEEVNLTTPASVFPPEDPTWAGYPIVDSWVETGEWLGNLFITESNFVFSESLDSWTSIEESAIDTETGAAWIFIIGTNALLVEALENPELVYSYDVERWFFRPEGGIEESGSWCFLIP